MRKRADNEVHWVLGLRSDNAGKGPPKQKVNPAPPMKHHIQVRATLDKTVMPSTKHVGKMDNAGKSRGR